MPRRKWSLQPAEVAALRAGLDQVRTELRVPFGFPPGVLAEAESSSSAPRRPELDLTSLDLLTIDPPGSMDLDQAMQIERRGSGYRVHYAIADVGAFVAPGGEVDREAHARGETLYAPDARTPLHPPVLSEGAASLLPGETRPALVWRIDLDSAGEESGAEVRRAMVRSRRRYDYQTVQRLLDSDSVGAGEESLRLLREVGRLREQQERERGGANLPIPQQEVVEDGAGYRLAYPVPVPVDGWNAQVSLLTGIVAADLMLHAEVGILRTLPAAPLDGIKRLRRAARALGVDWPEESSYAEMVHRLDPSKPQHAALAQEATSLLRGAGYTAFDGGVPELATHAAVAAEYSHVTAPLRRLVDRYAGEVCLAVCAGATPPEWVRAALPALPAEMAASDRRAGAFERAVVDLVEAAVLALRVGEVFPAVVVDVDDKGGTVQLRDPAVRRRCSGSPELGEAVSVRLVEASVAHRRVRFELA